MYTIKYNISNEIVIKNSKFITLLIRVKDASEVENILKKVKEDYQDASHYCYAYSTLEKEKANDDKEPSGTAGMPILNVLKKNQLTYVICIVIRYFGGIKLGAGGLVRAYSKSITEALKKTPLTKLIQGFEIEIHISYDQQKRLDQLLKNATILARSFQEEVILLAHVTKDDMTLLDQARIPYQIHKEVYIEKEFQ